MIIQEKIKLDGKDLIKTYSNNNKYIIQKETGIKYEVAVDIPNRYSYIESEEEIKPKNIKE